MNTLTTAPSFEPLSTLPVLMEQTKSKNLQLNKLLCSFKETKHDTSTSGSWEQFIDGSCMLPNDDILDWNSHSKSRSLNTHSEVIKIKIDDLIFTYNFKNTDLNKGENLFFQEYSPIDHIKTLHSLLALGEELFKTSRPRNEDEIRIINDFVRSKTIILSSKKLI